MSRFALVDPRETSIGTLYDLMVAAVQPRPIGFVSTLSPEGVRNLAPFSFFMAGGVNPPSLVYCPSRNRRGMPKDSEHNAEATGQFVVNVVDRAMADAMNQTGFDYAPEVDEWTVSGLTPAPCVRVRPERVLESPVAFECEVFHVVRHGEGPHATVYVIGEVLCAHVREDLWNEGRPDATAFRLIGRLGGAEYVDLAAPEIFTLPRPSVGK